MKIDSKFIIQKVNPNIVESVLKIILTAVFVPTSLPQVAGAELLKSAPDIAGVFSKNLAQKIKKWAKELNLSEEKLRDDIEKYYKENTIGRMLFDKHICYACNKRAKAIGKDKNIPDQAIRESMAKMLSSPLFHSLLTDWILTADPSKKENLEKKLNEFMIVECGTVPVNPTISVNLKKARNALQQDMCNDDVLSAWQANAQLNYLVETASSIKSDQKRQMGKYTQEELDSILQAYCDDVSRKFGTISNAIGENEHVFSLEDFYIPLFLQLVGKADQAISLEHLCKESIPKLILGNAGDGKSTTFRWLTHKAFQEWNIKQEQLESVLSTPASSMMFQGKLPIPILCRDMYMVEKYSIGKILADYLITMKWVNEGLYPDATNSPLYKAFWRELEAGRILFLFDGLDEIIDIESQTKLLEELIKTVQAYPNNSLVITARPFVLQFLPSELRDQHLVVRLVSPKDQDKINMIEQWVDKVYADSNHYSKDERKQYKQALMEAVTKNTTIGNLTNSPLVLLMMLVAFDADKKIPSKEKELYQKSVSHFMLWKSKPSKLSTNETRIQLEYLALEMSLKGVHQLREREISFLLENFRNQLEEVNSDEIADLTPHKVHEFLSLLKQHSGLFFPIKTTEDNDREEIWWEFRHSSFQYYLAACAINHEYCIKEKKIIKSSEFVQYLYSIELQSFTKNIIFEPNFINILNFYISLCEDDSIKNKIIYDMAYLFESSLEYMFVFYPDLFLVATTDELIHGLCNNKESSARQLYARSLAPKSGSNIENALITQLYKDENSNVRKACAQALSDKEGENTIIALIKKLKNDTSKRVREACARSLYNKNGNNVISALIQSLNKDAEKKVREASADSLENKYGDNVINALIRGLKRDPKETVRNMCAYALCDKEGQNVIKALTRRAAKDPSTMVRETCKSVLEYQQNSVNSSPPASS